MSKEIPKIKAIILTDDSQIEARDYINKVAFEEDILEYVSDDVIEEYVMTELDLNTTKYHLENAWEDDLLEALEDTGYNFTKNIDIDDAIDLVEKEGYTVIEESEVDFGLDSYDANRMYEIIRAFVSADWNGREEIYKTIIK